MKIYKSVKYAKLLNKQDRFFQDTVSFRDSRNFLNFFLKIRHFIRFFLYIGPLSSTNEQ
jgi:hypothetical protein